MNARQNAPNCAPYNLLSDGSRWCFNEPPESLPIEVVTNSLSQIARFGGQAKLIEGHVYTVAQHSIKVSYLVPTLEALLHDAHEIIIGDICSPMKKYLYDSKLMKLDNETATVFANIFGTGYPLAGSVVIADKIMCLIEARDLMYDVDEMWFAQDPMVAQAKQYAIDQPILRPQPWSVQKTREMFTARYEELKNAAG